jgi:demethylmenaquinone methyltransferase/2-methoxy-6-polyprenyl-1,4-benzoquinol methylase
MNRHPTTPTAAEIAANKATQVEGMFDRIARRYDLLNDVMTFGMHRLWKAAALASLGSRRHGNALDVATGTGDLALALATGSPTARVIGLDFSAAMLVQARARSNHLPNLTRLAFVRGDALRLPFDDATFSAATSGFALRNVADLGTMFRELARVLAPGGRVALLDLVPLASPPPWTRLARLHLRYVVPRLGTLLAGDATAYTYLPTSVDTIPPLPQLETLLATSGVTHVRPRLFALGTTALITATRQRIGHNRVGAFN